VMRRSVILVLFAVVLAGCTVGAAETPMPPTVDATGGVTILFQRSGGIAPSELQWAIYSDGRVVTGEGEEKLVAADRVQALLGEIDRLGYRITVNDGGRVKTVTAVEGAADTPDTVLQIIDAINSLVAGP
jgi:hypothetical protein